MAVVFKTPGDAYRYIIYKAEQSGITKRQLALRSSLSPQHLSNLTKRGDMKMSSIKKIADTIGMDVSIRLTKKIPENELQANPKAT